VLRDESYVGRYIAFRTSAEPIVVPIPAIITEDAWSGAQARLSVGRQQSKRGAKYNYLLARRLKCSCGCSLQASSGTGSSGRPHLYYRCTSSASNVAAAPCGMKPLQAHVVDTAVWQRAKELLKDPESLDLLLVEAQTALEAQNADLREDIVRIDRSIARVEENLRRSAQAYDLANTNDQAYSKALFARDMASAEEQLKSLAVERNKTSARLASASISTEYRDRVRGLAERVKDRLDAATFEQCVEVVSELDMSARLVLGREGLRLRLYLFSHEVGALWADLPKF
jgi:site-specific DNA recombinase